MQVEASGSDGRISSAEILLVRMGATYGRDRRAGRGVRTYVWHAKSLSVRPLANKRVPGLDATFFSADASTKAK